VLTRWKARRMPRTLSTLAGMAAAAMLIFAAAPGPARAAGVDYQAYQVPFAGPVPADGTTARAGIDDRATAALTAVACGGELGFWDPTSPANERMTATVAKIDWWGGHREGIEMPARITDDVCRAAEDRWKPAGLSDQEWADLAAGNVGGVNARLAAQFGPACSRQAGGPVEGIVERAGPGQQSGAVHIAYSITRDCLQAQVRFAINGFAVDGHMGTDKTRCMQVGKERHGDWDMALIELIRMAYLADRYPGLLGLEADNKLRDWLLTADGPPADTTYSLLGCGNLEESTGTAEDRADDRSGAEETLNDLGEFISWLWLLIFIAILIAAVIALVSVAGAAGFLSQAALAAIAGGAALAALIAQTNIPETENHLLMINSSKYLKNQQIIADLGPGSDAAARYEEDQRDLKEIFLEKAKSVLSEEFIEYNSRPYSRLSLAAFFNLHDFAQDTEIQIAARSVLDYSFAKFSVGSHEGRRFAPYRRKREYLRDDVEDPPDPARHTGQFDQVSGADHLIDLGLLYAGQTQQLSGLDFPNRNFISRGAAKEMIRAATSNYRPEDFVVDLAIRKQDILQRLKYDGAEIYSSGPGFLISGGGVTSGLAYSGTGIEALDRLIKPDLRDDLGTAFPTTIFLAGSPDHTTLDSLIRIEGVRTDEGGGGKFRTYDHNLCVWRGFACGLNIVIPADLETCLTPRPGAPDWSFIDTAQCRAFTDVGPGRPNQRLYIVIHRRPCPDSDYGCRTNAGFVEVMPVANAPFAEPFLLFADRVVARNPTAIFGGLQGEYNTARGQKIRFAILAHQDAADDWEIRWVDGQGQKAVDDWTFAEGDVMNGAGDGRVTIRNPFLNRTLDLDLRDEDAPKRTIY
jgi:hypothetical protein